MVIITILPLIFWAILWCYWLISAFHAKKSVHTGSWWFRAFGVRLAVIVIVILAIYTGHGETLGHIVFIPFASPASGITKVWIGIVGVVLCAVGVVLAIWARVYLGKNWGMPMTLREKPELVTSGPYKFVRHPIYTGFLLGMFGTALADGAVWLLILFVSGIYFIYSAKMEEKMMTEQFPNEYLEYKKRTKMVIPFVL